MRTPYTIVPTGHEVTDRNLRAISDALRTLTAAVAAPDTSSPIIYVGRLTATGSLTLPAGLVAAQIVATGDAAGGGQLNLTLNGIGAGYSCGADGGAPAVTASFPLYADFGAGGNFDCLGDITHAPGNIFARFREASVNTFGYSRSGGFVAGGVPTTLTITAAAINSFIADVWAQTV